MELSKEFLEISQLIANLVKIRDFTINAVNNFNLNKATSREMAKMLTLLDKQISEAILSDAFKNFVNFNDEADKVLAEVIKNNNLKSAKPVSENKTGVAIDAKGNTIQL